MNWEILYVGIKNDYISPSKGLKEIDLIHLESCSDELLGELYYHKDSKVEFLKVLNSFILIENINEDMSIQYWSKYFLSKIIKSNDSLREKLEQISQVWAMFNYPDQWRDFIYYMPVNEGGNLGREYIYEKFKIYVESL